MATEFHEAVIKVIKRIPRGRVATYGQVAELAGNPRGARQVVRTLHSASEKHKLPWHRVINREGRISLAPGEGFELQRAMLKDEGIVFEEGGRIDLKHYRWRPKRPPV